MITSMRMTIRLDDKLLAAAKVHAARTGKTLTAVIEDALRETLARHQEWEEQEPVKLTTVPGKGVQPAVNLDDSAALLIFMEESDDNA